MSFNSTTPRAEYTATASQTVFPFLFKIYLETDIKIYLTPAGDTPDDATDILTINTDYTVTINGDAGGEITLVSGATNGDTLVLERDLPITRSIDYQTGGDLLSETLDTDQEYQTYLILDRDYNANRSLILPSTDITVDSNLPKSVDGGYLKLNAAGTAFEYVDNLISVDEAVSVTNIAQMLTIDPEVSSQVTVAGYYDVGDQGGGIFNYDASQSAVNNGGTVIDGWVRQQKRLITVRDFGAVGDGATNDTTSFSNAITWAMTEGETLRMPSGNYKLVSWATKALTATLRLLGDGRETTTITGAGAEYLFSNIQAGLNIEGIFFHIIGAVFDEDIQTGTVNITELTIKDCEFEDVAVPARYRTYALTSSDVLGENIHITGNVLNNCGYGFKIEVNIFGYSVKNNIMKTIGLPYRTYARDTLSFGIARDVEGISMGRDSTVQNTTTDTQGDGDISGNVIYDVSSDEAAAQSKVAKGIVAFGSGVSITDNKLRRITLTDAAATNADGIYWKGSAFIVKGNNLLDAGYNEAAIKGKGSATTVTSENNIVSLNIIDWTTQTRDTQNGISIINGKSTISENIILHAIGNAIETSGDDVKVHDNKIKYIRGNTVSGAVKVINVKDGQNCKVNNNDIILDGTNNGTINGIANETTSAYRYIFTASDFTFTAVTKTIASPTLDTTELWVGRKVVIAGSTSNNGTFTVATIASATSITVTEAVADESAGASVTFTSYIPIESFEVIGNTISLINEKAGATGEYRGLRIYERGGGVGMLTISNNTFTIRDAVRDIKVISLSIAGNVRTGALQNNTNDCTSSGTVYDIIENGTFTLLGWDNNTGFASTPS